MTDISTDLTTSNITKFSHSEVLPSATLQGLSSLSQRTPKQVFSCYPVSTGAGEESNSLHNKNSNNMNKQKSTSPDMYEVVTNRIIERLEQGELTWRKTWSSYGLAKNYVSGKVLGG